MCFVADPLYFDNRCQHCIEVLIITAFEDAQRLVHVTCPWQRLCSRREGIASADVSKLRQQLNADRYLH